MGHQVIIYGIIEGISFTEKHTNSLPDHNEKVINKLPSEDSWPYLTRSMFALPVKGAEGTYQTQVIHFGLSIKDEPPLSPSDAYDPKHGWPQKDRQSIYGWMAKFEKVLRNLYWYGANVHVSTDFEPDRVFYYTPTEAAVDKMVAADPQTINEWELKIINIAALST